VWRWGLWFAVLAGFGEAVLVAGARSYSGRLILLTSDVIWMAPAINTLVFSIAAALLTFSNGRLKVQVRANLVLSVFVFLFLLAPLLLIPGLHPYAALALGKGVSVQAARLLAERVERFDTIVRRSLPLLAAVTSSQPWRFSCPAAFTRGRQSRPPRRQGPMNR
jgi:hypothetical protein